MPTNTYITFARFVDGPCGVGKTHAFIELTAERIKKRRDQKKHPLRRVDQELLDQVQAGFNERGASSTRASTAPPPTG